MSIDIKRISTGVDLSGTKEYEGRTGVCRTRTPFVPIRDKVLIKAVWEESPLVVKDENAIRKTEPKFTQVVGYGDEVRGLEIFDEVKVGYSATVESITFAKNEQSIKNKQALLKDIVLTSNAKSVYMVEYYCVPYSSIIGIMK